MSEITKQVIACKYTHVILMIMKSVESILAEQTVWYKATSKRVTNIFMYLAIVFVAGIILLGIVPNGSGLDSVSYTHLTLPTKA